MNFSLYTLVASYIQTMLTYVEFSSYASATISTPSDAEYLSVTLKKFVDDK